MKFFKLSLVLFLFGCGPSPEEIEKSSNELFEKAVSMTDSEPCLKLDAFEEMIRFNRENEVYHNIIRARRIMKPLEEECNYEKTRNKSIHQEKVKKNLKSIVFKCSAPEMFDSNAYPNEATYVITGNYLSRSLSEGRSSVFGAPEGSFSKYFNPEVYIKLSKDKNANNYENYDSYVLLNKNGNIFISSGDFNVDNINEYWLGLKYFDASVSFGLSRDDFKLISGTQYETITLDHNIVGKYSVDWTFKYRSACRTLNEDNLHSYLFSKTDSIKKLLIENERKKLEREDKEEALRIQNQKQKNKI
jgi:hypothetical protein